jgi:hypothetical protein
MIWPLHGANSLGSWIQASRRPPVLYVFSDHVSLDGIPLRFVRDLGAPRQNPLFPTSHEVEEPAGAITLGEPLCPELAYRKTV